MSENLFAVQNTYMEQHHLHFGFFKDLFLIRLIERALGRQGLSSANAVTVPERFLGLCQEANVIGHTWRPKGLLKFGRNSGVDEIRTKRDQSAGPVPKLLSWSRQHVEEGVETEPGYPQHERNGVREWVPSLVSRFG